MSVCLLHVYLQLLHLTTQRPLLAYTGSNPGSPRYESIRWGTRPMWKWSLPPRSLCTMPTSPMKPHWMAFEIPETAIFMMNHQTYSVSQLWVSKYFTSGITIKAYMYIRAGGDSNTWSNPRVLVWVFTSNGHNKMLMWRRNFPLLMNTIKTSLCDV